MEERDSAKRRRMGSESGSASLATSDFSITQDTPIPDGVSRSWTSGSDSDSDSSDSSSTESENKKEAVDDEDAYDIEKISMNYTWSIQRKVRHELRINMFLLYDVLIVLFNYN